MSVQINISGTIIDIPSSGTSPNWSPAIIRAFQAIEGALQGVAGPFDVPPQVQAIDSYNPGSNVDLQDATFPTSDVRSVELIYAVYRETTTENVSETGTLSAVFDASAAPGVQWNFSREAVGDAFIEFAFLDNGQVQFTTEAIAGANHTGVITFQAKALLQNS